MKIGLVLEGGAMRGMYTCGVIDTLLENNIKVDCIIGVSAGALFGINYKSRQIGRGFRFNMKYIKDKRYMGLYPLITTGNIVNEEFCFKDIPDTLDDFKYDTFKRTKEDFYAVVTNVETGKPEYIQIKDAKKQYQYLRASGSLPFVSKIVEIDGKKYLDGGLSDSIPVKKMQELGVDKIIVVLTRPKGYVKRKSNMIFIKARYKEYPKFVKTVANRVKMYNDEIEEIEFLEEQKDIFVIRPTKDLEVKRIEKNEEKLTQMYKLGIKDTKNVISNLKEYLKDNTKDK